MTNVIWKYRLGLGAQDVVMPEGAKILSAQMQGNSVCIWAMVNPEITKGQTRRLIVVGTGQPWNTNHHGLNTFIGTVMEKEGFVWHVFEETA